MPPSPHVLAVAPAPPARQPRAPRSCAFWHKRSSDAVMTIPGMRPWHDHQIQRAILLNRRRLVVRSLRADAGVQGRPWSILTTRVEGLHGGPDSDPAER